MIKDLIKVANGLDSLGLKKEADTIDNMIRKLAEITSLMTLSALCNDLINLYEEDSEMYPDAKRLAMALDRSAYGGNDFVIKFKRFPKHGVVKVYDNAWPGSNYLGEIPMEYADALSIYSEGDSEMGMEKEVEEY